MSTAAVPLLETKLHVPRRRRGVVSRPRLHDRLHRGELPGVVIVSAPAGAGKTTLLTAWVEDLAHREAHVAWVSLDRRDSDPARYWSYVLAAVTRAVPGAGSDAGAQLQAAPTELEASVASLLNDLGELTDDLVLVLDDYHAVESLEVHESMRFLVGHLPDQVHLIVAGRADPPWPLSGLRAGGRLVEVRAADLRFTPEEASAYLNDTMGLELAAGDVATLEGRTEGWIAALQLAALSLQGRDDPATFITQFAGDDRFVVDYLVDEVLDRQSDEIRDFLLTTSVLSRLTGPLCAAVTGRADAKKTLEHLDRSNLFLVALDDRRQWYRYHHLFADVLRARLADEHPDRLPELHRRASAWFEAGGDRAEAVRHALAAPDHAKAAELIELSIPGLRQARQEATLRHWLEALPEELYANRPVLSIGLVGARMGAGDTTGVDELLDGIDAWLDPERSRAGMVVHDEGELARLATQAAMYRAGLALLRGDLHATISHAERAAGLSGTDDHLGRGAASALVGLAQWTVGDLASAERHYTAAIEAFTDADHLADILGCSLGLADMQRAQGNLEAADRTLRAGLELATAHAPLRGTADMHVGLAELHVERNELDAAADHLRTSQETEGRLALGQYAYRSRVVEARLGSIAGDHAAAVTLLRDAVRHYDTDYSPGVRPATATLARAQLTAGDVAAAQRWAAAAGVTAHDELSYLREYEHFTLARLLLATGRPGEAVTLLERLQAAAEAGGRQGSAIEAQVLLALAYDALGQTSHSLVVLEAALHHAEAHQYVRIFLDEGAPMTTLLRTAVRHGRAIDQANALLAAASGGPSPARPQELVDPLSPRELDVLRLLRSELSGPEIAAELVVSLNTVRTHTKNIFTKLGVTNRRAAVRRAAELGL